MVFDDGATYAHSCEFVNVVGSTGVPSHWALIQLDGLIHLIPSGSWLATDVGPVFCDIVVDVSIISLVVVG